MGLLAWLERRSCAWIISISILWTAAVGTVDHITSAEISVGAFYLIGIALAAWCCGKRSGFAMVILCATVWFSAEARERPDGHLRVFVYWNTFIRICYFLPVMYLTAHLRERLLREEESARTDSLTGAHNSRSFYALLELERVRSERSGEPMTLVYLDVDNFKQVNDTMGHSKGDEVLRQVVSVLRENLRPTDSVGRLGGDEFAILMPRTNRLQSENVVSRLRELLLAATLESKMPVTFSIGVAAFTSPPASTEEAIRMGDQLMYNAKQTGKNQIQYLET